MEGGGACACDVFMVTETARSWTNEVAVGVSLLHLSKSSSNPKDVLNGLSLHS